MQHTLTYTTMRIFKKLKNLKNESRINYNIYKYYLEGILIPVRY